MGKITIVLQSSIIIILLIHNVTFIMNFIYNSSHYDPHLWNSNRAVVVLFSLASGHFYFFLFALPWFAYSYFLAAPRQRIELTFDEHYYIEPSFECRFDHLEVRDGPFGFSPLVDRYCGVKSPPLLRSTGRFMWIKFSSDEELEGLGFRAKYSFIPGKEVIVSVARSHSGFRILRLEKR